MFVLATYYNRFLRHSAEGWHTAGLEGARQFASLTEATIVKDQLELRPVFAVLKLRVVPLEQATEELDPRSLSLG